MPQYEIRFDLPSPRCLCPGGDPHVFVWEHQGDVVCRMLGLHWETEKDRECHEPSAEAPCWAGEHISRALVRPGELFAVVLPERCNEPRLVDYLTELPAWRRLLEAPHKGLNAQQRKRSRCNG